MYVMTSLNVQPACNTNHLLKCAAFMPLFPKMYRINFMTSLNVQQVCLDLLKCTACKPLSSKLYTVQHVCYDLLRCRYEVCVLENFMVIVPCSLWLLFPVLYCFTLITLVSHHDLQAVR